MSILGYSTSYFLPEYWSKTPFYGEKLIPLLDYILSTEYEESEKLAKAYYAIEDKYKNSAELPIGQIEALIEESGYSYILHLLGDNEESMRLLVHLIVLIHQLKGTKLGIYVVLNLLRKDSSIMVMQVIGSPMISSAKEVSGITENDYLTYNNFTANNTPFSIDFKIRTTDFSQEQCIMSISNYGARVSLNTRGALVLSLGSNRKTWNIIENKMSSKELQRDTEYFFRLQFDGYEYQVQISQDGKRYTSYISAFSRESLGVTLGVLYLGVDNSTGTVEAPFKGYINFSNFSVEIENIEILTWFEQTPVAEENTFIIKTELDVDLVSASFFENFAKFIKQYVYPSISAFEASLNFNSNLTFLPYTRSRVTYVAQGNV